MDTRQPEHVDLRYGVVTPHLQEWRTARGLSQAALARRAKISRETVRGAELGRPIRRTHLAVLARVLGIELQRLLESQP
jgi:transcriptional regulator with XRE-family HTH domain